MANKMKENDQLRQELERYELDYLAGSGEQGSKNNTHLSATAVRIEAEQLRKDNQRLMAMLRGTKEYEHFGEFIEDSGGNAMRLPEAASPEDLEQQQWVPSEAF